MHKTYLSKKLKPFNRKPKDLKRDSKTFIPRQNNNTSIYFAASFNFLNTSHAYPAPSR